MTARFTADEAVRTDAEGAALARLRELTGATDGPMERHGLRLHLIAERLAARRGLEVDREIVLVAALLHDAGGYPGAFTGGPYVTDGRRVAEEVLEPFGWEPERRRRCLDAVELHHHYRAQWDRGPEVELLRRADRIDLRPPVTGWLREIARRVPRRGLYREVGRIVGRSARAGSLPKIFFVRPG
ncbi:MAG TPA: HD domain-containing protein [Solirubrobacteraceae bacterium]|nr:HD domain-containing protein [Solirubrobacteraceae bacterium]